MTIATVDLRAEAAAEVRRLTAARAILRSGDADALARLESSAPWLALPRRGRLRRSLGRRLCLLWRVAAEDAAGNVVASRIVPVLVETTASFRPAAIRSLLRDTDVVIRARVESACEDWRADVERVMRAFTGARLTREASISGHSTGSEESQPGLFDRRVERARAVDAAAATAAERAALERLRTIAASGSIVVRPARLLLVLVP